MKNSERILQLINNKDPMCDDCISKELKIQSRQIVNSSCNKIQLIDRHKDHCINCSATTKIVNTLSSQLGSRKSTEHASPNLNTPKAIYNREDDLKLRFNESISMALCLPNTTDYYEQLDFKKLLKLKSGYSRINDLITYKLTLELANILISRMSISTNNASILISSIKSAHPNAAGFDLDINTEDCNVIGEIKGNMPINSKNKFGADQKIGLTNDILHLFGKPTNKKEQMSPRSKINRLGLNDAYKFLGLYESTAVKTATVSWMTNLLKSNIWKPMNGFKIGFLSEENTSLNSDTVYIVFLTPIH